MFLRDTSDLARSRHTPNTNHIRFPEGMIWSVAWYCVQGGVNTCLCLSYLLLADQDGGVLFSWFLLHLSAVLISLRKYEMKKKKTKLNWWHMTLCSYGTLQVYKSISNFTCTDAHMHTDGLSLWFNFTLNSSILRRYYNANQVCDSPNPYQHKLEIFSNTHTQTNTLKPSSALLKSRDISSYSRFIFSMKKKTSMDM